MAQRFRRSLDSRRRLAVPAVIALAILITSVLPVTGGGGTVSPLPLLPADKVAHVSSYLLLAGSLAWAVTDWVGDSWRVGLLLFGLVFCFGAGIEVIQAFLPTRAFSLGDMAANGLGAAAGLVIGSRLRRIG